MKQYIKKRRRQLSLALCVLMSMNSMPALYAVQNNPVKAKELVSLNTIQNEADLFLNEELNKGGASCDREQVCHALTKIYKKNCEISNQVADLDATVQKDFAGTFTTLNTIINKENIIISKEDVILNRLNTCCSTIINGLATLTDTVEEDFAGTFSTLADIRKQETVIKKAVDACCNTLAEQIEEVKEDLDGCCEGINSKIDTIINEVNCKPTPIVGQTTITAAGTYCLVHDITGGASPVIVISSNDVVLDLNAHKITNCGTNNHGIVVTPGQRNIVIKNGSIERAVLLPACATVGNGIDISSSFIGNNPILSSHIRIEKVFINNWNVGVYADQVAYLEINDVQVASSSADNIRLTGCNTAVVGNSLLKGAGGNGLYVGASNNVQSDTISIVNILSNNNTGNGIFVEDSTNVHIEKSELNENRVYGLRVVDSSCVEVLHSVANGGNCVSQEGFDVEGGSNVVIQDCIACGNCRDGFFGNGVKALCIFDSVAKGNSNGFYLINDTTAIIRNNTATNNTLGGGGYGFFDNTGNSNQYYNNTACNNVAGQNFSASIVNNAQSPVTSPMNARGYMNVDCSNTQEDQVAEILSKVCVADSKLDDCCFDLNSKLDKIDVDLLNCCSSVNSKLDALTVDVDDCCATVNSKLDSINANVSKVDSDVNACCVTLASKIDEVDVEVAECCATLNSKLDALSFNTSKIDVDLANCCATVNSKLDTIEVDLTNCCSSVNSKLDVLLTGLCTQVTGQTTITAPGTYCLVVNVVGASPAIVIDSNDVVLDLNGFKITNCGSANHGVLINAGHRNIVIKNGTIEGCTNTTGNGVEIPAAILDENPIVSSHIRLENLFIKNWTLGIHADQVSNLEVNTVQVSDSSSNNIELDGCDTVSIQNCLIKASDDNGILLTDSNGIPCDTVNVLNTVVYNNTSNGIFIESSTNIQIENCELNENLVNGLRVLDSSCIEVVSSVANGGSCSSQEGFDVESSSNVVFKDCVACGNCRDGFFGNNVQALCIFDSVAKANNSGFNLTNGTTAILRNNTATNNTGSSGWGFFDDSGSGNQYYNNSACNNASGSSVRNFSPDIVNNAQSPVTSPMNARGFMNVDCANSQVDQVAQTLSKVCVLDSKLDECCFVLNSKSDSLADCCSTVNSKLDELLANVSKVDSDLNACCETLNSKVDALNVDLDECCATVNSKLDALSLSTSKVDFDVNSCCVTLNSKIDALNVDLDECCATINSKLDELNVDTSKIDADLANCCATLNSKIDDIDFELTNCCATVISKIDVLVGAQCTHVTGQTTITTPGVYCLVVNVVGASPAIVIDSDNVVLDLMGNSISNCGTGNHGVSIVAGHNNIEIRNGTIEGCTDDTGNGIDIPVTAAPVVSSSDIRLKDLFIKNWNIGINAINVSNLKVSNVQVVSSDLDNIVLSGCNAVTIENCLVKDSVNENGILVTDSSDSINIYRTLFNSNKASGLFVNSSANVHVDSCEFNANSEDGVRLSLSSCIEILNSVANGGINCASEEGFDIEDCFDIVLKNCVACGNCRDGFFANNVQALCIFDSVAKANNSGFNLTNGTAAILRNNTATNNVGSSGWGFFDDSGSVNQYYNNTACNNHSGSSIRNFSPDIINDMQAPVTSPMNARGAMNVDCSNSQVDQVAQTLSKVCVLDSKIDVVIQDNSKIDADLLNCCFTLSSKIDFLDFVELADCCATIESKLDAISAGVSKIDSETVACCFTLNSKVDILEEDDFTIESKVDALSLNVQECCSKMDICCETLNSKIDYLILRLVG